MRRILSAKYYPLFHSVGVNATLSKSTFWYLCNYVPYTCHLAFGHNISLNKLN